MTAVDGQERKLSSKQERAIVALLSTRTVAEAAAEADVSARTLERWLSRNQDFISAYRATRTRVVEAAIGRLQDAVGEAVECLRRNMREAGSSTQVRAASIVLDHATRAIELYDLAERLDELEGNANGYEG